ncbi:MAG: hypothetical protein JSW50_05540 [Candidatus Latescibacterota bacterium]|nr:MAG: hypothetical protein JSW50_05540 [Candidatus Latescibacterota bacterium]
MITRIVVVCLAAAVCLLPCSARGGDGESAESVSFENVFPTLEGWTPDGEPEVFYPETLFEYINGAAEVYLTYDFVALGALTYDKGEKQSLTIDVYRHKDLRNAFGIYSAEKPEETDFLSIGSQGYYAKGILNFFKGPYYVKVMGYYLEDDEAMLTSIANEVAGNLDGEAAFPKMLSCFPAEGKITNSEKFIARNFLGHGFLHAAYTASYDLDGASLVVFIIEAADAAESQEMLNQYFELVKSKDGKVDESNDTYRFVDPRRKSAGPANLRARDRYIWGLFTEDAGAADVMLAAVEGHLTEAGLIE